MARLVGKTTVVDVCGEMTWPAVTGDVAQLGYLLRYCPESLTRGDQLTLASIVAAWMQLVQDPQKKRNAVCREIVQASRSASHDV